MSSTPTRLSLFVAVAAIGLAASSALAQAPAVKGPAAPSGPALPPPFQCAQGEVAFKTGNGSNDNFAGTADPPTHPTNQFATAAQLNAATNKYDQTASNYRFGDSFTLNQSGPITKLKLTTRVKSNSSDSNNDGFSFSTQQNFAPAFSYGFAIGAGQIGWGALTFYFDRTGNQILVNNNALAPAPGTYQAINFFTDLDNGRALHIYVQDDTSVDFIQIEGCYKPAPKYDLVATKKHDGNVYILNVTNAGSTIMPTGHVDVVEVIPAGLVVLPFTPPPGWTCPGLSFPMVGPDAFTCSYQVPAGGIATNASLPAIVIKTEGKSECPNCMKAKLYLKDFQGGAVPVQEGDMKNNASCTK